MRNCQFREPGAPPRNSLQALTLLLAIPCLLTGAGAGIPAFATAPSGDGTPAAPNEFRIADADKICCRVRDGRYVRTSERECRQVHGQIVTRGYCRDCRDYANAAIEANRTNKRNHCGFSGPRWRSGFDHHYDWCRKVSPSRSQSESRARERQLASCKSKMKHCRAYAHGAVLANRTSKRKGCGFAGPRWRSDFDHHYDWCMKVPRTKSRSETRARRDQLLKKC